MFLKPAFLSAAIFAGPIEGKACSVSMLPRNLIGRFVGCSSVIMGLVLSNAKGVRDRMQGV